MYDKLATKHPAVDNIAETPEMANIVNAAEHDAAAYYMPDTTETYAPDEWPHDSTDPGHPSIQGPAVDNIAKTPGTANIVNGPVDRRLRVRSFRTLLTRELKGIRGSQVTSRGQDRFRGFELTKGLDPLLRAFTKCRFPISETRLEGRSHPRR